MINILIMSVLIMFITVEKHGLNLFEKITEIILKTIYFFLIYGFS